MMKLRIQLIVTTLFVLALSSCADKKPAFHSVDITGGFSSTPKGLATDRSNPENFSLPDVDGKTRTIKDFAGKVVVVFFGFTQCPDVCPTTLAEVSAVKQALEKNKAGDGDKLQAVFITIDPERDSAAVLKGYVQNFDPSFVALRAATPEALAEVAKSFKIYYKKIEGKSATSYSMDHTAASYVFDPKGRLRLFTRYGMGAVPLSKDIQTLLAGN